MLIIDTNKRLLDSDSKTLLKVWFRSQLKKDESTKGYWGLFDLPNLSIDGTGYTSGVPKESHSSKTSALIPSEVYAFKVT